MLALQLHSMKSTALTISIPGSRLRVELRPQIQSKSQTIIILRMPRVEVNPQSLAKHLFTVDMNPHPIKLCPLSIPAK